MKFTTRPGDILSAIICGELMATFEVDTEIEIDTEASYTFEIDGASGLTRYCEIKFENIMEKEK